MPTGFVIGRMASNGLAWKPAALPRRCGRPLRFSTTKRATPPNAAVAGGFLRVTNAGAADEVLLAASTEAAERVEIHEMKMRGEVMEMRQLTGGLDIPAGNTVELKPGGYHLMLIKPKRPLAEGQSVTLTLRFRNAGERKVAFMVHKQMPMADHDMSQHKH